MELGIALMQEQGLGRGSNVWVVGDGPFDFLWGPLTERGARESFPSESLRRQTTRLPQHPRHPITYRWFRR
jgi:hypothetical protein